MDYLSYCFFAERVLKQQLRCNQFSYGNSLEMWFIPSFLVLLMFIEDSSLILQNTQNCRFHFWQKDIGFNGLLKNKPLSRSWKISFHSSHYSASRFWLPLFVQNDAFDSVLFVFVLQRTEGPFALCLLLQVSFPSWKELWYFQERSPAKNTTFQQWKHFLEGVTHPIRSEYFFYVSHVLI